MDRRLEAIEQPVTAISCREPNVRLAAADARHELSSMASSPDFDYRRLPIPDRLQLVEDIWDSIAQDAATENLPLSDDEKAMLDERLADLEANPGAGRPWPEVRASIIERFGKHRK